MINLAYPQLRGNIEAAIEGLADTELQERAWIGRKPRPSGECPRFDDAIHWLFDDSGLDEGVYACIGYMFYDEQEARSVEGLMKRLDELFGKYGKNAPFDAYFHTPEWPAIVANADACLRSFKLNDGKNTPSGRD
jgi:hypothetical protein